MKFGRSACLAGLVALGAWSVAACSSDKNNGNGDGGTEPDGGGATPSTGGKSGGTGGSTSNGGTAGKTGTGGGTAGKTGTGGSTTSVDGGNDGGVPTVKITTTPKEGATYNTTKIPVAYEVTNFDLKPPGTGASCKTGVCGHVHVNIDGADCNVNNTTQPYNTAGNTSPLTMDLSLCKAGLDGAHSVVVSLHNDDHSPVKVNGVAVESDPVNFRYAPGDAGAGDAGDAGKK